LSKDSCKTQFEWFFHANLENPDSVYKTPRPSRPFPELAPEFLAQLGGLVAQNSSESRLDEILVSDIGKIETKIKKIKNDFNENQKSTKNFSLVRFTVCQGRGRADQSVWRVGDSEMCSDWHICHKYCKYFGSSHDFRYFSPTSTVFSFLRVV